MLPQMCKLTNKLGQCVLFANECQYSRSGQMGIIFLCSCTVVLIKNTV